MAMGSWLVVAIGVGLFIWRRRYWAWASVLVIVGLTDFVEDQQWKRFEEHTPWEYVWPLFVIILAVHLLRKRAKKSAPQSVGEKRP